MEKMLVYNMREFDEGAFFEKYAAEYGIELVICRKSPTLENADLAKGCQYVNIITTPISRALLERYQRLGVKALVTRTIGSDHIDKKAAKELGIHVTNTPYAPDGVAEYTILLMLSCLRKMKSIMQRYRGQDYTLKGLMGQQLTGKTVGVIGMGRIGTRVCSMLSGFGCNVLAYAPHKKEAGADNVTYVDLDTLFRQSDLITLHAPATESTYHMIDKNALEKMRDGVILVNTARGALIDTKAAIDALESGKIGAMGLDVVEDESSLFYYDLREQVLPNRDLYLLQSYPNVIITHHMAFYTQDAVETMVRDSVGAFVDKNI
jgi:D-lactate dehydrogenase